WLNSPSAGLRLVCNYLVGVSARTNSRSSHPSIATTQNPLPYLRVLQEWDCGGTGAGQVVDVAVILLPSHFAIVARKAGPFAVLSR
ncbi:hypothetical protein CGCVW01_v001460, partial [Colletotrichum viniferum]